jgi:hypothetical protein
VKSRSSPGVLAVRVFHAIMNVIFDLLFYPFRSLPSVIALGAVSFTAGIVTLLTFRYLSNQKGIKAVKNRIMAHLLEIGLFKDDPVAIVGAQWRMLSATFAYVRYAFTPFVVMLIPFIILILQLNFYFAYRPLRPGESAIVTLKWNNQIPWNERTVRILAPEGLAIETPALRIAGGTEMNWRLRAKHEGKFELIFQTPDQALGKEVLVTERLARVSPTRRRANLLEAVFAGGEAPLPQNVQIEVIEVRYRPMSFSVFGWNVHWVVLFFVFSLLAAYTLRGPFRVEI